MGARPPGDSGAASSRLYRLLLRAYPADFREEYGREMARMFDDLCRDARRRAGRRGLAALWARTLFDLARSAPSERMDTLLQDLRYGARALRTDKTFAAVCVVALALGAGANTAIFSVVNGVLLRPLPFAEPDRLVRVATNNPEKQITDGSTSLVDLEDWRAEAGALEGLAAFTTANAVLAGDGDPERLSAAAVTRDFFPVFGVGLVAGRDFAAEEYRDGGPRAAILARRLWQRRFNGDASVVGRTISVSGRDTTVVGIAPDRFDALVGDVDIWLPYAPPAQFVVRDNRNVVAVGRLGPGRTAAQAEAELDAVAARLAGAFPKENGGWGVDVLPLQESITGPVRTTVLALFAAVTFVTLIACANVGNLLLSRAAARRREVAVRAALGATRLRIVRQMLTEGVLLYALGGLAGLAVAAAGLRALLALGPDGLLRADDVRIDGRVLAFSIGLSVVTGLLFGLAPALQASRADVNEVLKEAGRGHAGGAHGGRVRNALVVSEIALAFVLLIGAGLLIRSFVELRRVDPGFDPAGAVSAQVSIPSSRYDSPEKVARFYEQLLGRVAALPGVESAGATSTLPLRGGGSSVWRGLIPEGRPETTDEEVLAHYIFATPGYLAAMRVPILRGRGLTDEDRAGSLPVVVLSESLARRAWPGQDPVGRRVHFWHDEKVWREVVGVAADVKGDSLGVPANTTAYVPHAQDPLRSMLIVARGGDPGAAAAAIRSEVRALDSQLPVFNVRTLDEVVARSTALERFQTLLVTLFAAVALALATVGVYGVMSFAVAQRRHEIGVRIALGARPGHVFRLVVGHGVGLALAGVAIGLGGTLALAQVVSSFLFGVSPTDAATLAGGAALLVAVAALACYLPARRAVATDPMLALRSD